MMRSLYSGVAGLKTHQTKMDVIGNNIANVNTTGFKSSSVLFSDVLYQTSANATGATATTGGTNASQIGLGAKTSSIQTSITQNGSAQTTNNTYDMMLSGSAFFVVSRGGTNYFTKVGSFGVDMLAAGIGNIHGKYPANWKGLSFETLDAIQQKTGIMPLVLHGGTGIPADMIKKAITLGVSKINVNTECQLSFQEATRKYIEAGKDLEGKGFDPRKLLAPGAEAIKATVKEKMELFGSVGKA